MDIARLLAGMEDRNQDQPSARATPPDVLCITLREIADRYAEPCPFKVGDLVTARACYNVQDAGEPCVVLEVLKAPVRNFDCTEDQTDIASMSFGAKIDVRIAKEMRGEIVSYWHESWTLEPYTGPNAAHPTTN